MVCYLTSFKSSIVSVTIFKTFAAKVRDLDLGLFKITQNPDSWLQPVEIIVK